MPLRSRRQAPWITLLGGALAFAGVAHGQETPTAAQQARPATSDPNALPAFPYPDFGPPPSDVGPSEAAGSMGVFPLDLNPTVERYIQFFTTSDKQDFVKHLEKGGRYRAMVERIFQQEGVPTELFYIADVESGFDVYSLSRSGARGMWQFMAEQASDYGLKRTAWVDERQDPEKSTVAAAHYLKYLFNEFGDWYLAVAAYVAGPITIQRAVSTTGSADFWELARSGILTRNTRDYIPVLVAMATVARHPEEYGLSVTEDPPLSYETVHLGSAVSLQLAADCAGTSSAKIRQLNPSLIHDRAPAGFDLHVPEGEAAGFGPALSLVPPAQRLTARLHRLAQGESLAAVARRFGVSTTRLRTANELGPGAEPEVGQLLVIPGAISGARAGTTPPPAGADATGIVRYRTVAGDTWSGVARRFGVTSAQLRAWNRGGGTTLRAGRVLTIRRNAGSAGSAEKHY